MLRTLIKKTFDVRDGEFRISLYMLSYIFLIIAVLMIIKPTINALFLSELGVEQLPFAYLAVAVTAIIATFFYSKGLSRFSLFRIIKSSLIGSSLILLSFGVLLKFQIFSGWLLYVFYVWVALYAVLSASQFWVLANLIFSVREAKRLFGFIGSGAILGGIFGGYLTSLLAPIIGNDALIFIAAVLLLGCISLLHRIWISGITNRGKQLRPQPSKKTDTSAWRLVLNSKHLRYIAAIVSLSVLAAKLVDYLFSDFAAAAIVDPENLTSFFAFWFSTFNLLSLFIQLFFTQRIVGVWGVGFSLLLLPIGILFASVVFFIVPELAVVIVIKAIDGVFKQSVHKSATELLSLPLPFELKNRTKSFIDVVVDSIATGIAGVLLIFVVKGLELPSSAIVTIIIVLVLLWMYCIAKVRQEYYKTFRRNLEVLTQRGTKIFKSTPKKVSVVAGMKQVFAQGSESQILFMLGKLMEINDSRFEQDVERLLTHKSTTVRTAAIQNLYFLNSKVMNTAVTGLLKTDDEGLTLATLEYLLLHADKDNSFVYQHYLDHENQLIANAALYCLARESQNNSQLQQLYNLSERVTEKITAVSTTLNNHTHQNSISTFEQKEIVTLLKVIGAARLKPFYKTVEHYFKSDHDDLVQAAIFSAGLSEHDGFIIYLVGFLPHKNYRQSAINALQKFGPNVVIILTTMVSERLVSLPECRLIPAIFSNFSSPKTIHCLFRLIEDQDLSIRLESIRALSALRKKHPTLKFDRYRVIALIYEECTLYQHTLLAMHTQIIISYKNRTKSKKEISEPERDARSSLLELLERRLDAGLERIFKLLGLRYAQKDINIAYEGLISKSQDVRTNALEFLDNLLTGELKKTLLPIFEESALDTALEDIVQKIKHKIPSEIECFKLLLSGQDLKLKLATLYLIQHQRDEKYIDLLMQYTLDDDLKIRTFAKEAWEAILEEKSN